MARPKIIRFYEQQLPSSLPESHQWLVEYHKNCKKLIEYMTQVAKRTACHSTILCLTLLREHLLSTNQIYNREISLNWYANTGPYPKGYKVALLRLADIYDFGEIKPLNLYLLSAYNNLSSPWDIILSTFLSNHKNLSEKYAYGQLRHSISRFFIYIQNKITDPHDIDFKLIDDYCNDYCNDCLSQARKSRYFHAVSTILLFMADHGLCIHGLGWYPLFKLHKLIIRLCDFTIKQQSIIENCRNDSLTFPAEEFAQVIPDFLERLRNYGYSNTQLKIASYVLHNLLLFLEMHKLGYHYTIAIVWLEYKSLFISEICRKQMSRIIYLFSIYTKEGEVIPQSINRSKPLLPDTLPVWCKTELDKYILLRTKEGLELSSLQIIRLAVTRFCSFLVNCKLNDFSQLTVNNIINFNLNDKHKTPEAKNAYNTRIRKFIRYLEHKNIVSNGLHQALYCTSATKEHLVVTLTQHEKKIIKEKLDKSESPIELRDKAIILIGLRMGLRASDIISIKLSDINWDMQFIRVIQQKTKREICIPMPVEVGNAIYIYLKQGRPNKKTNSPYVFLKSRAPYNCLEPHICNIILKKLLPDRNISGSGFHVLRKTFATDMLCNGVCRQGIADLLGHSGTQSLDCYLSLDEMRMTMCPLSLAETELEIKGERYGIS